MQDIKNKKYIVKTIRDKDGNIQFFLYGLSIHVDDMFLCANYIKEKLAPEHFDYKYDFFDTYESGIFIKDNIEVKINWSIYTDYDFIIDKYSTNEQIKKVEEWVTDIFDYLINQDKVEKNYINVDNFEDERIVPILKPSKLNRIRTLLLNNIKLIFNKRMYK